MSARDDESHLILATASERILVSANVRDFASLHQNWLQQGRQHAGILLIPQQRYSTGEIVRRFLSLVAARLDPITGLFYLSSF